MALITHLSEPQRKSVYNILKENLELVNRTVYLHRYIFIGEHGLGLSEQYGIGEAFRTVIEDINYSETEKLTGVLLCYPQYFCHVIEGSDDGICRCFQLTIQRYDKQLGKLKILAVFNHIGKRLLDTWMTVTGKPPRLLDKLDKGEDLQSTFRHVVNCVKKLFKLCIRVRPHPVEEEEGQENTLATKSLMSIDTTPSFHDTSSAHSSTSTAVIAGTTPSKVHWRDCLPEYALLQALFESEFMRDARVHLKGLSGIIPDLDIVEDLTWPVPNEMIPMNLFDKPIDPVADLPRVNAPAEGAEKT